MEQPEYHVLRKDANGKWCRITKKPLPYSDALKFAKSGIGDNNRAV